MNYKGGIKKNPGISTPGSLTRGLLSKNARGNFSLLILNLPNIQSVHIHQYCTYIYMYYTVVHFQVLRNADKLCCYAY